MPEYRCYVLDRVHRIIFPIEIEAEDLGAAVRHGLKVLYEVQTRNPYSGAENIEIWQGTVRVFPQRG
jgi:hypothetical protein